MAGISHQPVQTPGRKFSKEKKKQGTNSLPDICVEGIIESNFLSYWIG